MGEWKRIYSNPKRLATLALITLLSVAFFLVEQIDFLGQESVGEFIQTERYSAELTQRVRGRSNEEIVALLEEEHAVVDGYSTILLYGRDDPWLSLIMTEAEIENTLEAIAQRNYFSDFDELDSDTARLRLQIVLTRIEELQEQAAYVAGYADYLDSVQKQTESLSQSTLFSDVNSFSHRNLVQTAEEFDTLRNVTVSFGANRSYERWVKYELADYLYLIFIILFVFAFLEERRAGLWSLIRACRDGRGRLGLQRVAILAFASVLGVALVYGVNLLLSLTLSEGWEDMGRSVQSLSIFRTLTQHLTIGQWIAQYLLVKAAGGFLVGLILWCLLSSISNVQFSLSVLGVVVVVEYALFTFLPAQSIFNPVKYFNLFSYIRTSALYTEYLNINLFGYPFGSRRLALVWLPVFTLLFFAWAMLIQIRRRPAGNWDILSAVVSVKDRIADFFRRHLSIGGWELYKLLVYQRGILILFVILLAGNSLFNYLIGGATPEFTWYEAYLKDMAGPIDERTDEYIRLSRELAGSDPELLSALDRVEARVGVLRQRAEAGGYEPWIIYNFQRTYEGTYGPVGEDLQRMRAAEAVIFLLMCCAAISAFERQAGMTLLLRSLKRGRRGLFMRKLLMTLLMTAVVFVIVYAREWSLFIHWESVDLRAMYAPVGNVDALACFPLNMTVGQYIGVIYVLHFIMLFMLAMVVMFISERVPTAEASYIVNIALLGLPAILLALGINVLRYISPVIAISATEGLWSLGSTGSYFGLLPCFIWTVIGLTALVLNWRKWVGTKGHAVRKKALQV